MKLDLCLVFIICNAIWHSEPSPCDHYLVEHNWQRSTRHVISSIHMSRYDTNIRETWYRFTSKAGNKIPHGPVAPMSCGTENPIYIASGALPKVLNSQVTLNACYDVEGSKCIETISILAMLCRKNEDIFHIYFLKRPLFPASYCAGTEIPCSEGFSSPTGFTINGKCNQQFPIFTTPQVHYKVQTSLSFVCNFTTNATTDTENFKMTWYNSLHDKYEVYAKGSNLEEKMVIKWTELYRNTGFRLGDTFFCTVQSWYQNSPFNKSRIYVSNYFFAGIRIVNRTHHLEEGFSGHLSFESTIPILCKEGSRICGIKLSMLHDPDNGIASPSCFLPFLKSNSPLKRSSTLAVAADFPTKSVRHSHINMSLIAIGKTMDGWKSHKKIPDIQITVADKKWGVCSSTGDPHITTFGSLLYHHYQIGDYHLVQTKDNSFQVQVRTWKCAKVSCNCGIAVREGEDIVVIDMCKDSIPRPYLPRRKEMERSEGTIVTVDSTGRSYTISFSSGATIIFNTRHWYSTYYFGDINVKLPPSYYGNTGGLCGTYDSRTDNELLSKNGTTWDSELPSHSVGPEGFTESWRIATGNSLFYYKPKKDTCKRPVGRKNYCKCVSSSITCGPIGSPVRYSTNQKPITFQNEDYCSRRKRRSVGKNDGFVLIPEVDESSDYVYDPVPLPLFVPAWPTKTGKTEIEVRNHCTDKTMNSQVGKMCKKLDSFDFTPFINQCVEDTKITDDYTFVTSAMEALAEMCKDNLISNVTYWKSDKSGNATMSLPPEIFEISCPGLCSGKGTCVNGTCQCFPEYTGPDCSVNITAGPTFSRIPNNGLCDVRRRDDCTRVRVIGRDFIASKALSCRIAVLELHGQVLNGSKKQFLTNATMLSFGEMTCDMVNNPVGSFISSKKGIPHATFQVEISNDGKMFSKESFNYTIYDSKCFNCTNGTCQFKSNKCLINGYCYNDGEDSPRGTCIRCNPRFSVKNFYPVKTGVCANITTTKGTTTTLSVEITSDSLSTRNKGMNGTTANQPSTSAKPRETTYTKQNVTSNGSSTTTTTTTTATFQTTMATAPGSKGKLAIIISFSTIAGILVAVVAIVCVLKYKKGKSTKTHPIEPSESNSNIELQRVDEHLSPE